MIPPATKELQNMTGKKNRVQSLEQERRRIYEMIDASAELAAKLGKHPLRKGCACIACADKRKRLVWGNRGEWKFRL